MRGRPLGPRPEENGQGGRGDGPEYGTGPEYGQYGHGPENGQDHGPGHGRVAGQPAPVGDSSVHSLWMRIPPGSAQGSVGAPPSDPQASAPHPGGAPTGTYGTGHGTGPQLWSAAANGHSSPATTPRRPGSWPARTPYAHPGSSGGPGSSGAPLPPGTPVSADPASWPGAVPAGNGYGPPPGPAPRAAHHHGELVPRADTTSAPPPPLPVDSAVARRLKRRVAERLHEQISARAEAGGAAPGTDQAGLRQRGRALIEEAVARYSDDYARTHGVAPTHEEDRALSEAVYDLLFRAGRLQPHLDDPEIENIVANGCDEVWISRADEPLRRVDPIADSDEELVELLQDLARRHGGGERMLSTAHPTLALRLEGGMRLQAMIAVTPRPYVAIRRHRVASATLGDMVRLGTLDATTAAFLAACIRARKNVMVTGTQGVGKTSLLRALAAEIPPHERIGTLETEYELWLHELGRLHQVVPMEAREGNGERGADGRGAGEITLGDLIPPALRMTLSRIIVGEVRSSEVVPMLRVMTNGEGGSMCTLHARAAHMIVDRIAELCLEYGPRMTDALAYRLTANALDFVVHLEMVDETAVGGRRHRFVSHILELTGLGENGRPAMNTVFAPRPEAGEPRAVPHIPPACLDDLRRAGFDARMLDNPGGSWTAPLGLLVMGGGRGPSDPASSGRPDPSGRPNGARTQAGHGPGHRPAYRPAGGGTG